jgi:2-oxoglutarate/2-oxoacid ferredoxin oxidoreductase subunit alpha
MTQEKHIKEKPMVEKSAIVVKFVGDSGDGMQLTGTLFAETAALSGNDLATFPDFPAEVRAPQNTVAGVSGFQLQFGHEKIYSVGDMCDVLVAMNPASLKSNIKWAKPGALIITDIDAFNEKTIEKAGYTVNPLEDGSLDKYNVIKAPIATLTKKSLEGVEGVDNKQSIRARNMFVLGILYFIFNKELKHTYEFFEIKFKKKPDALKSNKIVLKAGHDYAETVEAIHQIISVPKAKMEKGRYRNITGNVATAWGLMAAAEKAGKHLFLGSYPITPATEILMELSKHKSLGIRTFQAEDEIAGICSAIGASFAGAFACTTTSGPGLSLKTEAMGLAVITELPLVIVNVQRGGPSTGLPTKSEQSDLLQALYGRNGEAPMLIMAASTPVDCFYAAFEISKLSMEHMTPAILLTEGYLGFGSELFKIPSMKSLPEIKPPYANPSKPYKPYERDPETLARYWAIPGTPGLRHRIGGLEKTNIDGFVSTDPNNHELMVTLREEKVQKIANFIPDQEVYGDENDDLLVVTWGSTLGVVRKAVEEARAEGQKISHTHFRYIYPLPKNSEQLLAKYKKIIVCELNSGQLVKYLRLTYPQIPYSQYNKVQGQPFNIKELREQFTQLIKEK